jgi:hypothetical protein
MLLQPFAISNHPTAIATQEVKMVIEFQLLVEY